jgi:hypothetical protein
MESEAEARRKDSWKKVLLRRQEMGRSFGLDDAYVPYSTLEKFNRECLQKAVRFFCKIIHNEELDTETRLKELVKAYEIMKDEANSHYED